MTCLMMDAKILGSNITRNGLPNLKKSSISNTAEELRMMSFFKKIGNDEKLGIDDIHPGETR